MDIYDEAYWLNRGEGVVYGSWEQYGERTKARMDQGEDIVVGAQCAVCAVEDWVCAGCVDSNDVWAELHMNAAGFPLRGVQSVSEMASVVAAR